MMNNRLKRVVNYYKKYGIKNLYGGQKYFDKEAVINDFLSFYPSEVKEYSSFDELYKDAYKYVGDVSFKEVTKDFDTYFQLLSKQDKMTAIASGLLAFYIAKEVDEKGYSVEKAIDKFVGSITGDKKYDVNNPFDIKSGKGHRMFGHDPATFGLKNIPTDYIIYVKNEAVPNTKKTVRIGDFLNVDKGVEYVSMIDVIWKYYGDSSNIFKGIINATGHVIVHFTKDLFTPDGLPIPFTSLLEKYKGYDDPKGSVLSYRDSFYKNSDGAHLKASDFTSLAIIELFARIYCDGINENSKESKGFKADFKMIAITTCLIAQITSSMINLSSGLQGESPTIMDGVKINMPLLASYMNVLNREAVSIYKANKKLKSFYKEKANE